MLFNSDKSKCEPKASIVVSKENKNSHIINNKSKHSIYQYHIDGDIIQSSKGKRCDYIVEVIKNDNSQPLAFIIELKGSDVDEAVDQIEATIDRYKGQLKDYDVRPRIILHKARTQEINGSKLRNLSRKYPYTIKKSLKYEEDI